MNLQQIKNILKKIREDAPSSSVGGGMIAGVGIENPTVSNQAEPGVKKKKLPSVVMTSLRRNQQKVL